MLKSFKYRLRPTKKQEKILLAHIEECRLLYNQLICARVQAWEKNKESLSRYEQQATFTDHLRVCLSLARSGAQRRTSGSRQ